MKVLYGIQGTGNGHVSRARDVIPALQKHCELDILLSGTQSEVNLPYPIRYRCKGASFYYNSKGGLDYFLSARKNLTGSLFREIWGLPVKDYDLIINDFEPVSAWAAKLRGVPCVALGHQAAFWSENTPRPEKRDPLGEWLLKYYAPAEKAIGFHFQPYDDFIFTPVIRAAVREQSPTDGGYYSVYLPAFKEQVLIELLQQIPEAKWQVFSRYIPEDQQHGNVWVRPVSHSSFAESLAHCTGIVCGAGFETPAEALYLGKKLMVVPIRGQYEQYCNAAALVKLGVFMLPRVDDDFVSHLRKWMAECPSLKIEYPDHMQAVADQLFSQFGEKKALVV
ncbi:MAG: glycosyl transferase [Bacteroidetes bacterium]|nr:MAG: glycosyl transferase [Bacteroidota bacterium]